MTPSSKQGFTLVEIMIVVAIIALLAAIAIPNVLRGRTSANETSAIGNTRAMISVVRSGAAPDTNELTTNRHEHTRKTRLRPNSPTNQPVAGITTALAARYEVITHEASSSPADSVPCRCGRMTLATLVSRICMKATTITVSVMAHFCVAGMGASGGGGVIARTGVRRTGYAPAGESGTARFAPGRPGAPFRREAATSL